MEYALRNSYQEYIVKKGDSLYTIANKLNVSVNELMDVNMLTSTVIYPDQVLLVPNVGNTEFMVDVYETLPGDNFYIISKKTGIDLQDLANYNDVGKIVLEKGQKISIPRTRTYVVDENDTVESILNNTNKSAEELLKANASSWLKSGTRIIS